MAGSRILNWSSPRSLLLLLVLGLTCGIGSGLEGRQHWWNVAKRELRDALNNRDNWNVAKNVIMFLGDGMGITTNTAARIFKGQKLGMNGEEGYLSWERFPNVALMKTYNEDKQVPDSAATATAYLCGVKTNFFTLGVDSSVKLNDCPASKNKATHTPSILQWAQEAGKDTGIVTTTRITHATPAATYAHVAHRNWECDSEVKGSCTDIAHQLVHDNPGKNVKVILGGGRQPMGVKSSVVDTMTCQRNDSRDLTKEWLRSKMVKGHKARYVTTARALAQVDTEKTDYLLGLFAESHLPFEVDRRPGSIGTPSLKDMTVKALRFLKKSEDGFFLLVEGGRIDHALHDNLAHRAFEEVVAMDAAVTAALKEVDLEETLIVVTADHSHVMTINGYPTRGNDILGLVNEKGMVDNLPYTTLMFTNGPGYNYSVINNTVVRHDPSTVDTTDVDYRYQAAVPMPPIKETHGGEDVGLWAIGPMSHLFHRTHEQHYIAHAMAYAACIGPSLDDCKRPSHSTSSSGRSLRHYYEDLAIGRPRKRAQDTKVTHTEVFKSPVDGPEQSTKATSEPVENPKFPTLSPVLQQLLDSNKEKILTSDGPQSVNSFSNAANVEQLLGRSVASLRGV
ncbi:alkaline phosphatase-like [Portunus trituberculatus]|uniref:alkaline phosphatase-like n=1 Tax=Portunus trituberculatus TaxID=210409 RepID=UPI001E1CFA89|nr:alkaline phosphatase-like [Portunus trituberculatus]